MRLGILSDTHDQWKRTDLAVSMLLDERVDVIVHCGDFVDSDMLRASAVLPCYFVFGNNDVDEIANLQSVAKNVNAICLEWGGTFQMDGKRIGVTHGHLRPELHRIFASGPNYLLTGHTHIRHDRQEGTVRRINPGALRRAKEYSVAVLDLKTDDLRFLPIAK